MGSSERVFLACIPFVRNIAEYTGRSEIYKRLTEVLHLKENSLRKTYQDLVDDYHLVLENIPNITYDCTNLVVDKMRIEAASIVLENLHHVELEEKIILAIAIRLNAEDYMLKRLANPDWEEPSRDQTRFLFNEFSRHFGSESHVIAILDQVNIMTPENIHINSFMFEPILDMAAEHLYQLHEEIQNLLRDV